MDRQHLESFMGMSVKSSATTGSSALLQEFNLSVTPFSITSSVIANGLWSLICSSFIIYIFLVKGAFIDWFLQQPLLNVRTRGASQLASFLDEVVASSTVRFSSYIYLTSSPYSSHFILDLRELVVSCTPCFYRPANLIYFVTIVLLKPLFFKEPFTS